MWHFLGLADFKVFCVVFCVVSGLWRRCAWLTESGLSQHESPPKRCSKIDHQHHYHYHQHHINHHHHYNILSRWHLHHHIYNLCNYIQLILFLLFWRVETKHSFFFVFSCLLIECSNRRPPLN